MGDVSAAFKRIHNGVLSFASVTITTGPSSSRPLEILDVTRENEADTDLEDRSAPAFIAAATAGIQKTAESLTKHGRQVPHLRVALKHVVSRWPDTREDAVECAAGIAFCRAVFP